MSDLSVEAQLGPQNMRERAIIANAVAAARADAFNKGWDAAVKHCIDAAERLKMCEAREAESWSIDKMVEAIVDEMRSLDQ